MVELSEIKGIGPKKVEVLIKYGIKEAEQISIMKPSELGSYLGISAKKAQEIINDAKDKASPVVIMTAQDLKEYREKNLKKISTGSARIDKLLKGGVWTDAITEFKGEFGTGKTQISHQLVVNNKKQYNRKSAWVETEPQTFTPERIEEIAEAQGVKIDLAEDVLVVPSKFISGVTSQFRAYELIEKKIKEGLDIGLIVIDSFIAKFRSDYTGRTRLADRSQEIGRHIGYLQTLASKYNIAIVLTVQVMGIPDAGAQLGVLKKEGTRSKATGGKLLEHSGTFLVALDQISRKDKTWKFIVYDAPVPYGEAVYRIDASGIRDG